MGEVRSGDGLRHRILMTVVCRAQYELVFKIRDVFIRIRSQIDLAVCVEEAQA